MKKLFISYSATKKMQELGYQLKKTVRSAIKETLIHESFPYDAEVSVTFCDNRYIKALNSHHRGIDRHTDVLSFPLYEDGNFDPVECSLGAALGDIVISLERAKEQAEALGNSFLREVAFLAVHSTLHLLGYDHERSEAEDELQCRLQKEIISKVKIEEYK